MVASVARQASKTLKKMNPPLNHYCCPKSKRRSIASLHIYPPTSCPWKQPQWWEVHSSLGRQKHWISSQRIEMGSWERVWRLWGAGSLRKRYTKLWVSSWAQPPRCIWVDLILNWLLWEMNSGGGPPSRSLAGPCVAHSEYAYNTWKAELEVPATLQESSDCTYDQLAISLRVLTTLSGLTIH